MSPPRLRSHQQRLFGVVEAIASGQTDARDILAAVTPGGGKSLLPVIAASRLVAANIIDRVCWVVPRDSLRLQAEEAFADPLWRGALGHSLSLRAADNGADPSRGLAGYVTTYQGVAAAPDLHLREFRKHRTLLVVDEVHHLPALADTDPGAAADAAKAGEDQASAWSRAILPLLECATVRLLLSGTLERADGKRILWLPYRQGSKADTSEIELDAPGWAVIGYSRAQALQERAVLPVTFGALDGEARWRAEEGVEVGPHRLAAPYPTETTRPALFTALRTGFAEALLREAFIAVRELRARRRQERGLAPGAASLGLGKLLVVAPDQETAKRYLEVVRRWIPADQAQLIAHLATSDTPGAHEAVAAFRLRPEPSILVTVAMAYEGLDVPEVAVVAALTHIRSRPGSSRWWRARRASIRTPGLTRRSAPWSFIPTIRCSSAFGSAWRPNKGPSPADAAVRASRPPSPFGSPMRSTPRRTPSFHSRATRSPCGSTRSALVRNWPCGAPSRKRRNPSCSIPLESNALAMRFN
ncbi:MAG TPA: DEAD/DEAH box helicase family protein, partial [Acetobacteraceae bacterium]|nr:DEAD/DEAH box helicase family protein [Acetobacteraceae bacterium]